MTSNRRMEVTHGSHIGHVRRYVAEAARQLGADGEKAGQAAIAATELATNVVIHGGGGEVLIREMKEAVPPALEVHALDSGKGMENIPLCLRDGYSTAGSAGTGLGAARRMASRFDIYSRPGRGTAIWLRLPVAAAENGGTPPPFEAGGVSVAVKGEELCGDSWDASSTDGILRVLVADGLGHGPFAEEAAREAVTTFRRHHTAGPVRALEFIHQALMKTRGAAASLVQIQTGGKNVVAAGVGNVSIRLQKDETFKSLAGDNGTLGAGVRRISEMQLPWDDGSLLILHSDGISTQWKLNDYPGLSRRHPSLIAGVLYRDFRRHHDDATVVVVRRFSP